MTDRKLGRTGKFPKGKIAECDEGELQLAIGVDKGTVMVFFGKSVQWIAFPPAEARAFAELILERARALENAERTA